MKKIHIITANIFFFFNFKNCRNILTFLKSIALEKGGVILYKEVYYQFIKLCSKIPISSIITMRPPGYLQCQGFLELSLAKLS